MSDNKEILERNLRGMFKNQDKSKEYKEYILENQDLGYVLTALRNTGKLPQTRWTRVLKCKISGRCNLNQRDKLDMKEDDKTILMIIRLGQIKENMTKMDKKPMKIYRKMGKDKTKDYGKRGFTIKESPKKIRRGAMIRGAMDGLKEKVRWAMRNDSKRFQRIIYRIMKDVTRDAPKKDYTNILEKNAKEVEVILDNWSRIKDDATEVVKSDIDVQSWSYVFENQEVGKALKFIGFGDNCGLLTCTWEYTWRCTFLEDSARCNEIMEKIINMDKVANDLKKEMNDLYRYEEEDITNPDERMYSLAKRVSYLRGLDKRIRKML